MNHVSLQQNAYINPDEVIFHVLDDIQDGVFLLNHHLQIIYINEMGIHATNQFRRDHILERTLGEVLGPAVSSNIVNHCHEALTYSRPVTFEQYVDYSGVWYDIRISLWRDGFVVCFRNITRQKEAELSFLKKQQILDAFFQNTSEAVAILDKNFNFLQVNKVYAADNNRTQEEYVGKNHFELYPSDEVESIFKQAVATKKPVEIFGRPFVSPDNPQVGVTYWDWSLSPCLDKHNEIDFLIFCLRNVTAKRLLEYEVNRLDRLNLVGEMAASIGHEVRNPLTTVRGYLQLMMTRNPSPRDRETMTLMIDELDRANSIITEFLSLAKNKASASVELTLNQVIQTMLPLLQTTALEHRCTLHPVLNDTSKGSYRRKGNSAVDS